jgi:hypothetical protein
MSDDRCYGCCQENCGSWANCSCSCHGARNIIDMKQCPDCGDLGKHQCPGRRLRDLTPDEITVLARTFEFGMALGEDRPCKVHHRYKGLRRPRTLCEDCWRHWISLNPR